MNEAYKQALLALAEEEIPVGAVVVCGNQIVARAYNQTEKLHDVTAHAEMLAITSAANYLHGKYLNACTLYVTLEPCLMCAGALAWAQIGRLVYGASDMKRGYSLMPHLVLHPKTKVLRGIMAEENELLLSEFFRKLRN
ncbi:nucleoside deaminase [Rhodocytophaga rosea]|nr:nucleoside deaminase [Rhodocytophaga rosea]